MVVDADLLVHVVDASDPDPEGCIAAVRSVLDEIGAERVPEMYAFNKADLAPESASRLVDREPGSVAVSAATGDGLDDLLAAVGRQLRRHTVVAELSVPYDRGDILAMAHREGEVLDVEEEAEGFGPSGSESTMAQRAAWPGTGPTQKTTRRPVGDGCSRSERVCPTALPV
ncbi:MAG: hypothetical protein Ct9H300mP31_14130 [Acidimicrobiaceae bacterium]|nr:MAG: hypothetical protein Ct9H300mP31_14130 [Acidimicrobiaceae bacterium]